MQSQESDSPGTGESHYPSNGYHNCGSSAASTGTSTTAVDVGANAGYIGMVPLPLHSRRGVTLPLYPRREVPLLLHPRCGVPLPTHPRRGLPLSLHRSCGVSPPHEGLWVDPNHHMGSTSPTWTWSTIGRWIPLLPLSQPDFYSFMFEQMVLTPGVGESCTAPLIGTGTRTRGNASTTPETQRRPTRWPRRWKRRRRPERRGWAVQLKGGVH